MAAFTPRREVENYYYFVGDGRQQRNNNPDLLERDWLSAHSQERPAMPTCVLARSPQAFAIPVNGHELKGAVQSRHRVEMYLQPLQVLGSIASDDVVDEAASPPVARTLGVAGGYHLRSQCR